MNTEQDSLPDIEIGTLSIWIQGRPFPNSEQAWDRDYLNVRVIARMRAGTISLTGTGIRSGELAMFSRALAAMSEELAGEAWLDGSDLGTTVHFRFSDAVGHLAVTVKMTPTHIDEWHEMTFQLDQTDLKPILAQFRDVLARYPSELPPGEGG